MDHKNKSTDEIIRQLDRLTARELESVESDLRIKSTTKMLEKLTPRQHQDLVAHIQKTVPTQEDDNGWENILAVVLGCILFIVIWGVIGQLYN